MSERKQSFADAQAAEVLSVDSNSPQTAKSGRGIAVLAVLLALLAAGLAGYQYYQGELFRLEMQEAVESSAADAARPVADPRVGSALEAVQAMDARISEFDGRILALGAENSGLQKALNDIASTDRQDWELAEVEYLLRLANQSLLMGREVRGAIALMESADEILRAQDDPALHEVRAALSSDMASLRTVAGFDVEGAYLRLSALVARVPVLATVTPEFEKTDAEEEAEAGGSLSRQWWARIREDLDRYLVVRQHSEPVRPLLPLAEEQYLRMNLRLALEQAKLALLSAEPAIYRGALADADAWTTTYFGSEAAGNRTFLDELRALATINVAPHLPDISGSLRALRRGAIKPAPVGQSATPDEG